MYTGYYPVTWGKGFESALFFELVTKQGETLSNVSETTPIIFWFNGGPGAES